MVDYKKANRLLIYPGNCLRELSPLTDCSICEDICPNHTLGFWDNTWHAPNCSLCGLCVANCPTQVFGLDQFHLLQRKDTEPLSLCCGELSTPPGEALQINCLQQLSPLILMYLIYRHGSVKVYVNNSTCGNCPQGWSPQSLSLTMAAYHLPPDLFSIIYTENSSPAFDNYSRRSFFSGLRNRTERFSQDKLIDAGTKMAKAFSSEGEVTDYTHEIIPLRLPLLALYRKGILSTSADEAHDLPFRRLDCDACNFCGACARLCPTQALELQENDESATLLFHPELCIGCRICTSGCMHHGLSWGDYYTSGEFLQGTTELATAGKKVCTSCGHAFFSWPDDENDTLCRFCKMR